MYKKYFKRLLDVIIVIPGILIGLILMIPIAITIYLEDKGPVFYNAERLGKNGKVFKMYKFRSMKVNAPDLRMADGSTFNGENDPRLTKVGCFIRKTSLDEIPQLLNVLKGDMSLIGPRPDLPEHKKMYVGNEERKLEVQPGITGYSQAYFRNSIEWKERIQNDIYYIDHLTFIMDIKVLLKTIHSVFFRKNIYVNNCKKKQNN
ncbi:sugar transferase [Turicibacter bilis]|uniref:sugar transferase n=1 Tax=Turicibacter bilis TaxID=2735723 RepID=UPI003F8CB6AF